uniref:BED-type domain-containing protein n=1 Tax=Oryza punctata TaxID=4537 RepID=A0A0E0MP04_ORYPU
MEGLAGGHGALPTAGGSMMAAHLLGPTTDAGTVTEEDYYFVFVQQLVHITGGAAAPSAAAGISLPTSSSSSSVREASAVVDVTIDGLAAASHANANAMVDDENVLRGPNGPSSSSRGGGRRRSERRRRSVVWEHMELDPSGNKASCRYCTKTLSAKTKDGTTHLRRHVNRCALRELAHALDI